MLRTLEKRSAKFWRIRTHALHEEANFNINWEKLTFEGRGTSHQRYYLRKSLRESLEAYVAELELSSSVVSPGTIQNRVSRKKTLVTWMTKNDIWRFSQLTQADLAEFLKSRNAESKKGGLTDKTIQSYVALFQSLRDLRHTYTAPLKVESYEIAELPDLVGYSKPSQRWKPIPIEVAIPLLEDAIDWMEKQAPAIIAMASKVFSVRKQFVAKTKTTKSKLARWAYKEIEKTEAFSELAHFMGEPSDRRYDIVRDGIRYTVGAAITIILLITGIRISELASLKRNCISSKVHSDGHTYWYINGIAAKKSGRAKAWIAPNVVLDAIRVIEGLYEGVAGVVDTRFLFLSFSGNGAVPFRTTKVKKLAPGSAAHWFKAFARAPWREQPIPEGDRLHPHQARKTFARFTVKRDKRALGALAQHYGHVYTAVLDGAYVGYDIQLDHLLEEESQQELAEGLSDLLRSENLAGRASKDILEFRKKMNFGAAFPGKRALEKVVSKLVQQGVVLAPCSWGYCLYTQEHSACRGGHKGPNPVSRCPSTCSSCANFAVTNLHRTWWEERYSQDAVFLQRTDIPEQTKAIVLKRLKESASILQSINSSTFTKE